jgi:hypothetical protein
LLTFASHLKIYLGLTNSIVATIVSGPMEYL